MVLITLFNLPVELPKDSPAFSSECTTLVSGLPEWISRCTLLDLDDEGFVNEFKVKLLRVECRPNQILKLMAATHSALWHASVLLMSPTSSSPSEFCSKILFSAQRS